MLREIYRHHGDSVSSGLPGGAPGLKAIVQFDTQFDGAALDVIAVVDDLKQSSRQVSLGGRLQTSVS